MKNCFASLILVIACGWTATATAQVDPHFLQSPPSNRPFLPSQLPDLARMLDVEARNFVPTVRREVGGTRQGRQLVIRGNAMQSAVSDLSASIMAGNTRPDILQTRIDIFVRAIEPVQSELNNPAGTAPEASAISQRIGRIGYEINRTVNASAAGLRPPPIQPPVFPPPGAGYDRNRVLQLAQTLVLSVSNTNRMIQSDIGFVYPYDGAIRDLDAMGLAVQQLGQLAQNGARLPQLQAAYNPIRDRARRVDGAMSNPPSIRVRRAWQAVETDLRQLTDSLGLNPDFHVDPDRPVIIDPPAFPHHPWPGPPPTTRPVNGPIIALTDQLVAEVDAFIAAMQPNALKVPEGPQILQAARAFRNEAVAFRQTAAAGARPRQLSPSLNQLDGLYAKFSNRVFRVANGLDGPNINRTRRMGVILGQMRQMLATL